MPVMMSFTAPAIAPATTRMMIATMASGSQATTAVSRFGDRVGTEDAERELQRDQEDRVEHDPRDQAARVVPAALEHAADAAALHGAIEADPFEDLVDDLLEYLGDDPPDDQDEHEDDQPGDEQHDRPPEVRKTLSDVDAHSSLPAGRSGSHRLPPRSGINPAYTVDRASLCRIMPGDLPGRRARRAVPHRPLRPVRRRPGTGRGRPRGRLPRKRPDHLRGPGMILL